MTDDNLVGQTLAGKYRVEEVLGKGGMGLVVGARHIKLDEQVAIKLLRPTMMEVPGMVARFLREAKAACKIKSVHVARVTDVDTLPDGVPYMVMERLNGIDFSALRRQRGQLEVSEAVGYLREACDAIAEAHTLGIVHRDLKPGNLFLHRRKDGRSVVKVLDFGISKLDAPGEQDTTKTGQMMGSPKYMSPEQMLSMHDVDARSDIWSLGAILYELLTGRPPFVADTTPRVCALVLNSDPEPPSALRPGLPVMLERTILRCLEKEPDRRFASVADLVESLSPFGPAPPDLTRTTGILPVAVLTGASQIPSVTPTPATFSREDETKLEGQKPRRAPGRSLFAGAAAVALLGGLTALYVKERGGEAAPATTGETSASAAQPAATPEPSATSSSTVTGPPAHSAYSLTDLPDVPSTSPSTLPRPTASGWPGAGAKKPKPPVGPSTDPFGGRRN